MKMKTAEEWLAELCFEPTETEVAQEFRLIQNDALEAAIEECRSIAKGQTTVHQSQREPVGSVLNLVIESIHKLKSKGVEDVGVVQEDRRSDQDR